MGLLPDALPPFPWDRLAPYVERAHEHPHSAVNLSVGTPVDPTPRIVQEALSRASNAAGYPTTHGTGELRDAVAGWFARRRGVADLDPAAVLPTVGSKEFVGLLPALLGLTADDAVVHPTVAYPTYDVGARLTGAQAVAADDPDAWPATTALVWVNSPSNPTGAVASAEQLRTIVAAARERGVIVASDECYAELGWTATDIPSILDPRVCEGSHSGLLAVYSLSKQSNMAGYRAAFAAGDRALIARLLEVRKHLGMMVPAPVQAATAVALDDDAHVAAQRLIYGARRERLVPALQAAGLRIDHSDAGLYLWATRDEPCWDTVAWCADRGIVVAPGEFYGPGGAAHVRVALTASDEAIAHASDRLEAGQ